VCTVVNCSQTSHRLSVCISHCFTNFRHLLFFSACLSVCQYVGRISLFTNGPHCFVIRRSSVQYNRWQSIAVCVSGGVGYRGQRNHSGPPTAATCMQLIQHHIGLVDGRRAMQRTHETTRLDFLFPSGCILTSLFRDVGLRR